MSSYRTKFVRAAALVLAAALSSFPTPLRADGTPSVDELLAKARAAVGGSAATTGEREVWDIVDGPFHGTAVTLRRGKDRITTETFGSIVFAAGTLNGRGWYQNENGYTIVARGELTDDPGTTIVSQTVSRVSRPGDYDALHTIYANGNESWRYYDPQTFLLMRAERTYAGKRSFAAYEDYRADATGTMRARHVVRGSEGRADREETMRSDVVAPFGDTELAIPPNRRTLVEFPAGARSVRLPARIAGNGEIVVRVDVAGRGLDMLLDSGSSEILLDSAIARDLGLAPARRSGFSLAGTQAEAVVVPAMKVGALTLHDVVVHSGPVVYDQSPDVKVVGLLGFDFIAGTALKIDYPDRRVRPYAASCGVSGVLARDSALLRANCARRRITNAALTSAWVENPHATQTKRLLRRLFAQTC
jgi:hypothetical protein